jgi:hypothetical protein
MARPAPLLLLLSVLLCGSNVALAGRQGPGDGAGGGVRRPAAPPPPLRHARVLWDAAQRSLRISEGGAVGDAAGAPAAATSTPAAATGNYSRAERHASGFGQLRLETGAGFEDIVQAQAAGFLEGYLTAGTCAACALARLRARAAAAARPD